MHHFGLIMIFKIICIISMLIVIVNCELSIRHVPCDNLIKGLAVASNAFTQCAIYKAHPVEYCLSCHLQYSELKTKYDALLTGSVNNTNTVQCKDIYFNQDRINIIETTYLNSVSLWEKGFCDSCFDEGKTSNSTQDFSTRESDFQKCLTANSEDPCKLCQVNYINVNNLFNSIDKAENGKICYDIQDMMNRTRLIWSGKLKCCSRDANVDLIPFAIVSSIFTAVPIIFYIFMHFYAKRSEANQEMLSSDRIQANFTNGTRLESTPISNQILCIPSTSREAPESEVSSVKNISTEKLKRSKLASSDCEDDSDDSIARTLARTPPKGNALIVL